MCIEWLPYAKHWDQCLMCIISSFTTVFDMGLIEYLHFTYEETHSQKS